MGGVGQPAAVQRPGFGVRRQRTQRAAASSTKNDEKVNALVELAAVVTNWGDADMDPAEKQKLDEIKATLTKLQ